MTQRSARTAPAAIAAVGSALAIAGLIITLRPPSVEAPSLPPVVAFSQSFQQVAVAPATIVEADDSSLVLERLALAVARGEADVGALARACAASATEEVCAVWAAHPDWGVEGARRVAEGQVVLGATAGQVEAAWGPPEKKRAEGDLTVWCYDAECVSAVSLLGDRVVRLME